MLSHHERLRLEAIERGLIVDDPRLARRMSSGSVGPNVAVRALFVLGVAAALVGLAVVTPVLAAGTALLLLVATAWYRGLHEEPRPERGHEPCR